MATSTILVVTLVTHSGTMSKNHSGRTSEKGEESGSPLPLDTVFRVLSHHRRRMILYYLTTCNYPVPLKELIDEVTVQESETHVGDIPAEVYEQVALDLHHTQLPKLAEWGVIDYSKELNLVATADTLRPLDEYLHLAKQHDQQEVEIYDYS